MKVLHLSYSDLDGGAAIAAHRIHCALRAFGISSTMRVAVKRSGDHAVLGPGTKLRRALAFARPEVGNALLRLSTDRSASTLRSVAVLPSGIHREVNESGCDVVHLHWINGELISIEEIAKISKPIVWTLHDMWPFCGTEHYVNDGSGARFETGYLRLNRDPTERRLDLNRWTWQRKLKLWQTKKMHIVCPSRWMAECVRRSVLFSDSPLTVVPNCVDSAIWGPIQRSVARDLLGLAHDIKVVLFGAYRSSVDARKGGDLLERAIGTLMSEGEHRVKPVIFGDNGPELSAQNDRDPIYLGAVHDELTMRIVYAAADVMVVPSRLDNLPNTAVEAQLSGVPVVGFRIGGMPDIVEHGDSGYLAAPFDAEELACGISWALARGGSDGAWGERIRARAESKFSCSRVANQYRTVYEECVGSA